jgi:putative membrane protein
MIMGHDAHHHGTHIPEWSQLTFFDLWSPLMLLILLVIFIAYMLITGPYRTKFSALAPTTNVWRKISFALGLITIYVASGSPLAALGHHYLFSAHMMQQSLLYLAVPPLILLGTPSWWFERIANRRWLEITFKIIQHPLFALLNFNVFFSYYHIPHIFDYTMSTPWLHFVFHSWLQFCAIQMWLLVINPITNQDRLRPLQKIGYIFANGVLLTPACALIIFADRVLYDTYANAPVVTDFLSQLDDQQLGGVIMKLMQEAIYGLTLATVFYRWYYAERAKEKTGQLQDSNM